MSKTIAFLLVLLPLSIGAAETPKTTIRLEDVPGSKLKRGITEGVLDAPMTDVWNVITDYGHYNEFMPRVTKSEIKEIREGGLRYYSYLNMPWPISDVSYECDVDYSKDHRSIKFKLVPGTGKGVKDFEGTWNFEEFENDPNRTKAAYSLFFQPSQGYPNWAINMGTKHTIGKILETVQKRLSKLKKP